MKNECICNFACICRGKGHFKKQYIENAFYLILVGLASVKFWDLYMHIMCLMVCGCFFIKIFFRPTKKDEIRLNRN